MSDRWNRNLRKASAILLALTMGMTALPNALPAYAAGEAIVSTEATGNEESAPETVGGNPGAAPNAGDGSPVKAEDRTEASQEMSDGLPVTAEDRTEASQETSDGLPETAGDSSQETGDDSPGTADGEASGRANESVVGEDDQSGLVIEDGTDGVSDIVSEETPDDGLITEETEETETSSEGQPVTMTETAQIQDPLSAPGQIVQTQTGSSSLRRVRRTLRSALSGSSYAFSSQLGANAKAIYDSKVEWYATEHHTGEWSCKFGEGVYQFRGVVTKNSNLSGISYDKTDPDTKNAFETCKEQMTADMQAAADAFKHDHPEVFWIRSPKTYSFTILSVPGTEQTGDDGKTRGVFQIVSATYKPVETFAGAGSLISSYQAGVQAAVAKVREMADSWNTEGAETGSAAYQALLVRAADEYLCSRLFYDHSALNTAVSVSAAENSGSQSVACNDAYRIYTSAAAFLGGTDHLTMGAVCEGYAKAFKVLCDQLGVPAVCVSGLSDKSRTGSGHMWNLAQIGGVWYLVDVTWDDSDRAGAQASSRRYLLVSNYTNNTLLTSRQASGNFSGSTITTTFSYPAASDTCYETAHQGTTIEGTDCAKAGRESGTCTVCGKNVDRTIPVLGHDFQEKTVAATCTAKGRRSVVCSRCGEMKSEQEIPALGHSFRETSRKAATCTQKGSITETCSRCGQTRITELPARGHDFQEKTVAATCTAKGRRSVICSWCGAVKSEQEIPALGHSFKETSRKAATCTQKGSVTETCSRCGQTKVTELPALGHVYTAQVVEPTTSRGGYTLHTCIRCGGTWQDQYTAKLLKKTNLRKVSAVSKGKFRVTFKKNGKYTRYQIQYAGRKDFTGAKTRTVKNKKKTASATIRAGRRKTYYVRIRAVSGKRVGAWSRVLKVRTK
ncbi:transglutaminase domain-containing protein [Porcincola intestinalis]|uniref:transglutaminase domain-containing protein n=1 Tax=Porcincola intestinalis TaxID=2606632 RepID=UPI002A80C760|nr:transglutaminase domain-containing protein [Porcincola intestinalis]MDY4205042.1 hypothetical protein [Porcincola intestinalis]